MPRNRTTLPLASQNAMQSTAPPVHPELGVEEEWAPILIPIRDYLMHLFRRLSINIIQSVKFMTSKELIGQVLGLGGQTKRNIDLYCNVTVVIRKLSALSSSK